MIKEETNCRKIKAAETKNMIYESAIQLFGEYGFEKVSVGSIVQYKPRGRFYWLRILPQLGLK